MNCVGKVIRTTLFDNTLWRETSEGENFANFAVLWLFVKVFSTKFGGMVSFSTARTSNLRKFSP